MTSPFERPGDTPQQTGGRFEAVWAKFFGQKPTKGSGNQWHEKLDVGTFAIRFSLKFSTKDRLRWGSRSVGDLFKEIQQAITGQGGVGGGTVGALAVAEDDGEIYVVMKGHDFLRMVQSGDIHYLTPSKAAQKRSRAKIPALLRDDEAP